MPHITHFEISTDNPEAVQPFYQDAFGSTFQKFERGPIEYWLITTGLDNEAVIHGGRVPPRASQTRDALNTVAVGPLDATIKKIEH